MKNSMHLDRPRHPFKGGVGESKKPGTAKSAACHPNPGGRVSMGSANAVMGRGKK